MTTINDRIAEAVQAAVDAGKSMDDQIAAEGIVRVQAVLEAAAAELPEPRYFSTQWGEVQIDSIVLNDADETGTSVVVTYNNASKIYLGYPPYTVVRDGVETDDPLQAIADMIVFQYGRIGG